MVFFYSNVDVWSFLDALASLDFKLSVSGSGIFLQLAHLRVFQIYLSGSNTERTGEGDSLTMTCPDNYQINVEEAFYGNHEKGCAGSDQSTNLEDRSGYMVTYMR